MKDYYLINGKGVIVKKPWQDNRYDHLRLQYGNHFATYDQAKEARGKIEKTFEEVHTNGSIWYATYSIAPETSMRLSRVENSVESAWKMACLAAIVSFLSLVVVVWAIL